MDDLDDGYVTKVKNGPNTNVEQHDVSINDWKLT